MNLIINLDHDEWILENDASTLADLGFGMYAFSVNLQSLIHSENETEISFFNRAAYEAFKQHPEVTHLPSIFGITHRTK